MSRKWMAHFLMIGKSRLQRRLCRVPAPASKWLVLPSPAHRLTRARIDLAGCLFAGALLNAREAGYAPMGIAVLDEAGNVKAFSREDGASMFRFDVARAKDNPNFFVSLSATSSGRFLPQTGAVLIKDAAGNVLGAAGASGGSGDEDEAICIAGIKAAGLQAG